MKIPKIIHQIWFQGEEHLPHYLMEYHNTWIKLNPDYNVMIWDHIKIENLLEESLAPHEIWIKDTYYSYNKMIQKIDFAKYIILYKYGGIYMDMDIKCLQSINNTPTINDSDIIFSRVPHDFFQSMLLKIFGTMSFSDKELINNGTIMCIPGNEIILLTLKEAHKRKKFTCINNTVQIFCTTGPVCLTNALKTYKKTEQNRYNIHVLSNSYFEHCSVCEIKSCKIPKYAIGIHYFANSWVTPLEKSALAVYCNIKNNWLITLLIFIIIILTVKSIATKSIVKINLKRKK